MKAAPPYPAHASLIKSVKWAPESSIVRKAHGGDNWPITWADDGHSPHQPTATATGFIGGPRKS